ncbi:MAG TPA: nucleoside-diphosphate sugar epimerase/dehydratase [Planctomycetota bacterium]
MTPTRPPRRFGSAALLLGGLAVFTGAHLFAYLLRFEFDVPPWYWPAFVLRTLPFVAAIKLAAFYLCGVQRILSAYVGISDLFRILRATVVGSAALAAGNWLLLRPLQAPRTVLILDGLLTFLAVAGAFATIRALRERRHRGGHASAEPVFIVGAGDAGDMLLRELQRSAGVKVIGFLDDEPSKRGRVLRGVAVLGGVDRAGELAEARDVRRAFVAIPSASGPALRRVVNTLLEAGLAIKVLPPQGKLSLTTGFIPQLRDVAVEDLLRRDPVALDMAGLAGLLGGKVVLVTGAAGSIGSELCRQVLSFKPSRLVAVDCAETPLHTLALELRTRAAPETLAFELADVTRRERVDALIASVKPQVVFHAAALKHVPLLEEHPREAVRVNLGGTRNVAEAASAAGVEAFVLISTDKAVNPTSVMGSTKRLAELLLGHLSRGGTSTRFVSVRFGNVLGSNGSVLPVFREQLARGGPLTVTHPDMRRYFMTIPEAVQLVLQAALLGASGDVLVLDMGEPVKIVDLAEDLIRLSGLVPGVDVKVEFTGMRPGEKLFEELRLTGEDILPTPHAKIFRLRAGGELPVTEAELRSLEVSSADGLPSSEVAAGVRRLVPSPGSPPAPAAS